MKTVTLRLVALSLLLGGVLLVLGPNPAKAATITVITPTGAVDTTGEPVSADATITTGAGTISVTLTDNTGGADLRSVGQALSDFSFTLSNAPGTLGTLSGTGTLITLGPAPSPATGAIVTSTTPGASLTHWAASNPSDNTVLLTTLTGGQPNQMIIASTQPYPNANTSLTGGQFNPFVDTTGTFTLNASGVTAGTQVTSASFSFGTTGETVIAGVPEPSSLTQAISALGTLGFVGYGLRRRLKK